MRFHGLTIVTSCLNYGKYLKDWSESIAAQTLRPGKVCIFTHGSRLDRLHGLGAVTMLTQHGITADHIHSSVALDFGVARNHAVSMARSEWVMHLDADDTLCPNAVVELQCAAHDADVVQAGYERTNMPNGKGHIYTGADGLDVLSLPAIASGNSMFRRALWEQRPYRTDMYGAWDTALWIGFAHLGARFRPSRTPIFYYRYHNDSIFNRRRISRNWDKVHTRIMIQSLRRGLSEEAIQEALTVAMESRRGALSHAWTGRGLPPRKQA